MAGRGPAPKDPARRARRNKDVIPPTYLKFVKGEVPELPEEIPWHPRAIVWWRTWAESEQANLMTEVDWQFMLSTALLVHQFWCNGHWTLAAEIRLREAKFGVTPEDRARLRIQFADADEKDNNRPDGAIEAAQKSQRYGQLRALPVGTSGDAS